MLAGQRGSCFCGSPQESTHVRTDIDSYEWRTGAKRQRGGGGGEEVGTEAEIERERGGGGGYDAGEGRGRWERRERDSQNE